MTTSRITRGSDFIVVAAMIAIMVMSTACGATGPDPTAVLTADIPVDPGDYKDRYGRSLPMEDIASILTASALRVLRDVDWEWGADVDTPRVCVAINPARASVIDEGRLPRALIDDLVRRLGRNLSLQVYVSDYETAADRCQSGIAWHISFSTYRLGGLEKSRLTVDLSERFVGTFGGSSWQYTFVTQQDGDWVLAFADPTGIY